MFNPSVTMHSINSVRIETKLSSPNDTLTDQYRTTKFFFVAIDGSELCVTAFSDTTNLPINYE